MSEARSLRVAFESEDAFRREYHANIANGGVFVATNVGFNVRESVHIELALAWCGERIDLDGEIVHVVTPDLAGAGATPGVAVQFTSKASDLRDRFQEILGAEASDNEREAGIGRRGSRRAPARVPVSLRGSDGVEHEGRSRDLSLTGVLATIDVPMDVGSTVGVAITNPATQEEIELEGQVMRHVQTHSGGPVAMGISFVIPSDLLEEAEEFLKAVQVAESSRRLGGITGPISEIGTANLLQMFGTCAPKGTLTLVRDEEEGFILFEKGMLRGAQLGESYGRKALSRLLGWREGCFEFHARTDPEFYRGDPMSLDAVMLDAFRLQDEGQNMGVDSLPGDAKLEVDEQKVEAARDELEQAEQAILDLAAVGMSVSKVIDVIPEPDVEVSRAILGLLERGLIRLLD